jgi:hypothetical protein
MASDTNNSDKEMEPTNKKEEFPKATQITTTQTTNKNTSTSKATKSLGRDGKKESTLLAKANTYDIEIDVCNILPGQIELFLLQYLLEILDNKKISKHSIKARQLISQRKE